MIPIAKPNISEEEKKAVLEVLDSGMIAQGKKVKELEENFAKLCNTKHAIATSSGTTALQTALHALEIKEGDEIITTPFTFAATVNTIIHRGALPIFADIEPETFNIDPKDVEKKITPKTKAILPVDLYGQPYDYDEIKAIADKHNLLILEDAAQAVGADYKEKPAGSLGTAACFSLYATKNITCGEGGIITTDDDKVAELARKFRNHGQGATRYDYQNEGFNYRLTDIQASIGVEQLKKLEKFTERRNKNAKLLDEGLKDVKGIIIPIVKNDRKHVFHQYSIRVTSDFKVSRDELRDKLKEKGIICAVHYPEPMHLNSSFKKWDHNEGDLPNAEKACKEVLSLPVHPLVSDEDIKFIIKSIKEINDA